MSERNENPAENIAPYLEVIAGHLAKIGSDLNHIYMALAAGLDQEQTKRLSQIITNHRAHVEAEQFREDLDNLPTTEEEEGN